MDIVSPSLCHDPCPTPAARGLRVARESSLPASHPKSGATSSSPPQAVMHHSSGTWVTLRSAYYPMGAVHAGEHSSALS